MTAVKAVEVASAPHDVQAAAVASVAPEPVCGRYFPLPHAVHVELPATAEFPAAQATQLLVAEEAQVVRYLPAAHACRGWGKNLQQRGQSTAAG